MRTIRLPALLRLHEDVGQLKNTEALPRNAPFVADVTMNWPIRGAQ